MKRHSLSLKNVLFVGMIALILGSIFVQRACAMTDAAQEQCFFVLLPIEVRDRIAHYVDFCETDEEFVERVRNQKEVSVEHMAKFKPPMHTNSTEIIATYSIDQSKIIFLEKRDDRRKIQPRLALLDIQHDTLVKNRFADSAEYHKQLYDISRNIHGIALSHDGTMLAELQMIPHYGPKTFGTIIVGRMFYKDELMVKSGSLLNNTRCFTLSDDSNGDSYKIGFNKQGTKVLAYTIKRFLNEPNNREIVHMFFVNEEEHAALSVNSFDNYLRLNRICKSIEEQKK